MPKESEAPIIMRPFVRLEVENEKADFSAGLYPTVALVRQTFMPPQRFEL